MKWHFMDASYKVRDCECVCVSQNYYFNVKTYWNITLKSHQVPQNYKFRNSDRHLNTTISNAFTKHKLNRVHYAFKRHIFDPH